MKFGLSGFGPKSMVGLDIGSSTVKAVEISMKGRGSDFELTHLGVAKLPHEAIVQGCPGDIFLPAQSFDNSLVSGFPVFEFSGQFSGEVGDCPCDFVAGVTIVNSGNNIDHSLTVTNGIVTSSGSGTSAPGN